MIKGFYLSNYYLAFCCSNYLLSESTNLKVLLKEQLWVMEYHLMEALLRTQGLVKALEGKTKLHEIMKNVKKDVLMRTARNIIMLNLLDEVLVEVAEEKNVTVLRTNLRHFI